MNGVIKHWIGQKVNNYNSVQLTLINKQASLLKLLKKKLKAIY